MKNILILLTLVTLSACCGCPSNMKETGMAHQNMKPNAVLKVSGMTCEACAMSVTKNLKKIEGVTDVQVDVASGSVKIFTQKDVVLDKAAVQKIIDRSGYKLDSITLQK